MDKLQLGRGGGQYTFDLKRKLGGKALDGVVYYNKDLIGVVEDIGNSGLSQGDFVLLRLCFSSNFLAVMFASYAKQSFNRMVIG